MEALHDFAVRQGYDGALPTALGDQQVTDALAGELAARLQQLDDVDALLAVTAAGEPDDADDQDGDAEEAPALDLLQQEADRAEALAAAAALRTEGAREEYARQLASVHAQAEASGEALGRLAALLDALGAAWARALHPERHAGYDAASSQLLESLADGLLAAAGATEGGASDRELRAWQAQAAEVQRLQRALAATLSGAARQQVAIARMQAELQALEAVASGGDEGVEGSTQQEGLEAALAALEARCAGVAAAHAARPLQAQYADRLRAVEARCAAKRRAAEALSRHAASQVLLLRATQQEGEAVCRAAALAEAAAGDAAALRDASGRRAEMLRRAAAAAATTSGHADKHEEECLGAGARRAADTAEEAAMAALRALLREQRASLLPAHRVLLARLLRLSHPGAGPAPDLAAPQLSGCGLPEALGAAALASEGLARQAGAALLQAAERQKLAGRREVAQRLLVDFFAAPERLGAAPQGAA